MVWSIARAACGLAPPRRQSHRAVCAQKASAQNGSTLVNVPASAEFELTSNDEPEATCDTGATCGGEERTGDPADQQVNICRRFNALLHVVISFLSNSLFTPKFPINQHGVIFMCDVFHRHSGQNSFVCSLFENRFILFQGGVVCVFAFVSRGTSCLSAAFLSFLRLYALFLTSPGSHFGFSDILPQLIQWDARPRRRCHRRRLRLLPTAACHSSFADAVTNNLDDG